jgi:hypothetical protein
MFFEDIYSLFCSKDAFIIKEQHYLITAKNSRNVIKYYISKDEVMILLLNSFIYLTDVVIIGDLIMCIKIKYPSLPKPQLIKVPKPTSIMVKKFYLYLANLIKLKKINSTNSTNSTNSANLANLANLPNIYYDLYNNALKKLGTQYISRYEKIKTFYDGVMNTNKFINLSKCLLTITLPKDLIKYISEFIPYIYSSHKVYKISPKCKKCYNKYHAGITTNYHQVDGSTLCGLCNEDKLKHKFLSQICPSKKKNIVCICDYTTFCICKSFNMAFSHDIFTTRKPIIIKSIIK